MLKNFIIFLILVGAAGAGIYFLPNLWKQKGLALFYQSPLIPSELKQAVSEAESLLSNPVEKRQRLIEKLEDDFKALQTTIESEVAGKVATDTSSKLVSLMQSSGQALSEIKAKNENQPIVNIVAEKIAAAVVDSVNKNPDAEKQCK